jgi:putative ABC transport system ATP-binding protein
MTTPPRPPRTTSDIVRMSDVQFAWPGQDGFAFYIPDFSLARGERVLLTGPSGSGKSTFLSLLAGIVTAQAGRIEIIGTDLASLSSSARDAFRAEHFGIIFQQFNLLPYGSVVDNVVLPLAFAPQRRQRASAGGKPELAAQELLDRLGLEITLANRRASSLSVGQQQRVAAARALIGSPELIVADEPTSALDADSQDAFLDLLFEQVGAAGATLIMVSHDQRLAPRFDRVLRLDQIARKVPERVPA